MSKYTTVWSYLVDVAEALVSADEFDKLYLNTYPNQVEDTFKRVLLLFAEKEGDRDSNSAFLWEGTYRCVILRNSWGADADSGAVDELIGQAGDGGIGALASTLRDNLETNLLAAYGHCSLEFGEIVYKYRQKDQRHVADFSFTISLPELRGNRSNGAGGVVSILPSGSELDDLTDVVIVNPTNGQVVKYDSSTSKWINAADDAGTTIDELGDIGDVVVTTPADNSVLAYDTASGKWIDQSLAEVGASAVGHSHTLDELSDVNTSGVVEGALLQKSGSEWIDSPVTITNGEVPLHLPVLSSHPGTLSDGDVYIYENGTTRQLCVHLSGVTRTATLS